MIDLSQFIGKRVVLQLRLGEAWLLIIQKDGKAEPAIATSADGTQQGMINVPFLIGEVVAGPALIYNDQNNEQLLISINPEAILSVTVAISSTKPKLSVIQ